MFYIGRGLMEPQSKGCGKTLEVQMDNNIDFSLKPLDMSSLKNTLILAQ